MVVLEYHTLIARLNVNSAKVTDCQQTEQREMNDKKIDKIFNLRMSNRHQLPHSHHKGTVFQ